MGKAAGGGELVVSEMLHLIPMAVVYMIVHMFAERYAGNTAESVENWRLIILTFLAKEVRPSKMADFRGISLLSILGKWYMGCIMILAHRCPRPESFQDICIVGYEKHCNSDMITTPMQTLMATCRGWPTRAQVHN